MHEGHLRSLRAKSWHVRRSPSRAKAREACDPRSRALRVPLKELGDPWKNFGRRVSPQRQVSMAVVGAEALRAREQHIDARLIVLQQMGLAEPASQREWLVRRDFETVLKAMQKSADRQKMLASHGALLSDERLPFVVQQITPVASQADGRNFFRVEAHLQTSINRLRPGMEGVGKITVGENKLLWIWTHGLTDWLRTWAWKEMP